MSATTFTQTLQDQNRVANTSARSAIYQLLGAAPPFPCRAFIYAKGTPDANTVTIQPANGEPINGASSLTLTSIGAVTIKPIAVASSPTGYGWLVIAQTATTTIGGGGSSSGGPLTLAFNGAPGIYEAAYNGSLQATGGTQPYTYSLATGSSLPSWASLNSSTGAITGTPSAVGTWTFTGKVTDSTSGTPQTATVACSITVTAAGATGPVSEVTGFTARAVFENAASAGSAGSANTVDESWQLVCSATPPSDPRFQFGNAIMCPVAMLGASTTGTPTSLTVSPWWYAPNGCACTIAADQKTITGIATAVNPGIAPNPTSAQGNWCYIVGVGVFQIAQWVSSSSVVLATACGVTGAQTFKGCEFRFAMAGDNTSAAGVGDTCTFINGDQFRISVLSQSLNSSGVAAWTIVPTGSWSSSHTAGELFYCISTNNGNVDTYGGALLAGTTQCVNQGLPVGLPVAYEIFMPAVSLTGQVNSWPTSTTPKYGPIGIEYQTTGSLQLTRIPPTTLVSAIQTQISNSPSLLLDAGFESQGLGQSSAWYGGDSNSHISSAQAHSGTYSWEINNSSFVWDWVSQKVKIPDATQQYRLSAWFYGTSVTAGIGIVQMYFYNGAGAYLGSGPSTSQSLAAGWQQLAVGSGALPSGTVYINVFAGLDGTGQLWIDDFSLTQVPAVSSVFSVGSDGTIGINVNGTTLQVVGGVLQIPANSLGPTLMVTPTGATGVSAAYYTSANQYSQSGTVTASYTLTVGSNTHIAIGQTVNGPGITPGTTVNSISGTAIGLSKAATVGSTGTYYFTALSSTTGFPTGALLFNVSGSLGNSLWSNTNGVWTHTQDPASLITGTLAANVAVAGSGIFGTLTAVTLDAVTINGMTATISSTSGSTINIDSTNGIKITNSLGNVLSLTNAGVAIQNSSGSGYGSILNNGSLTISQGTAVIGITAAPIGSGYGGYVSLPETPLASLVPGGPTLAVSDGSGGYTAGSLYFYKAGWNKLF